MTEEEHAAKKRIWYLKNREHVKARVKAWRARQREIRALHLKDEIAEYYATRRNFPPEQHAKRFEDDPRAGRDAYLSRICSMPTLVLRGLHYGR